ncbi:glycosyltransferase family 4 protein [Candidatus Pelagibacter sp.]|uniref:glycosyltransferase family 4 protein n=1 Tax=Candidatus Pelagibacter sp. TaxID=2024849 RepID=UPI003F871F7F
MKVSIIVGGKFHAFNLAEQINNSRYLKKIITSYPRYKLKKYGIERDKIYSIILKEILIKFLNKLSFLNSIFDYNYLLCEYFDYKASKNIEYKNTDILVGWSGFSKKCFLEAKKFKCIKILERGSSHIQFQKKILDEEYKSLGIKLNGPSKKMISKELEEYNLADFICVPSEYVRQSFLKYGIKKDKIIKLPYGVDLKEFSLTESKKKKDGKFRIISSGSVSIRKGSHYLLEAFSNLKLANSELIFVGEISSEFKQIIKKYSSLENIKFINKQNQDKLKYFYNIADIFVLCSIEEGLAMVQAQAMACGLPVICTTNTGGSEIVDDDINGYIIPIRNTKILMDKIKIFYNDRNKLKKMSKNAHLKARSQLSWKKYGDTMLDIYQKLLNH